VPSVTNRSTASAFSGTVMLVRATPPIGSAIGVPSTAKNSTVAVAAVSVGFARMNSVRYAPPSAM
jgi:hypothetical protein